MTFPRHRALLARWREVPPAALQLARIAAAIGIKPSAQTAKPQTAQEFMQMAAKGGIPVLHGRPDDPMLAFLDLPPHAAAQ
jgi:hypothetical protein